MRKITIAAQVFLVLLLALITEARPSFAQVKSSTITGTVTDQTGAVLPNAAVTVTQQETNTSTNVQSDSKGEYTVPYLAIGHYTLTVSAPGFETYRKTDINLAGGVSVRADVPMAVGNTTVSVDVKADALAVQTENATVSDAVSSDVIQSQTNINGNSLYFATLESGIVGDPNQLSSQALGVGYSDRRNMSGMRINGGEIGSNDILLDGISIQGAAWHETAVLPNSDALAEVRVVTNNFTADTGMAQGVVQQTTKGGTNEFHGDVNFMLRNEDLNANSFSNKHQNIVRPKYRLLQGGGSVGGPIIIPHIYNGKDKLFFFGSFLRLTHSSSSTFQATVPTLLERVGNFSQTMVKETTGSPVPVNVYNPFTASAISATQFQRTQYPGNIVTNTTPYGLAILQGYPVPNNAPNSLYPLSAGGGQDAYHTNNFQVNTVSPEARNSFNGRIDFKPTANQSIYTTGGVSQGYISCPNNWLNLANGPWVNQCQLVKDFNPYGIIGDTIILNPTTVLDMHYGVTHINTQNQVPSAVGNPAQYGQPAFVSAVAAFGPNNLPGIPAITPYSALNSNSYGNKKEHQLNHFVSGSISKVKGNLTMKFGAEYRVYLQNWQDIQWQAPPLGTTNYSGQFGAANGTNVTALEPSVANQGFTPASVVAGVEGWSLTPGTAPILALASKYTAVYSQNTWRPTKDLLLSFGLRYEVQPGPTERKNRMASFDLTRESPFATTAVPNGAGNLGYLTYPGVGGYSRNLYNTTWNNVAPRIGITYQLTNNTVLRGGYGRNYLPSNTGYNANGTVYYPTPWDSAVNPIPFGLTPNGLPVGTFDQASNTYVIAGAGPVDAPANYGGTGSVTIFDRLGYKTGHTDQFNFFIERQLNSTWLVNVGYVGSRGGTLPWRGYLMNGPFSVNPAQLAAWRATWIANNGSNDPAQVTVANPQTALVGVASGDSGSAKIATIETYEPYQDFLNDTHYITPGSDAYNSFVAKVQHSTSHGLQFGANYTWSKTTGTVGNSSTQTFAESQSGTSSAPTGGIDYSNFSNNHSILDYDISNRFVLNGSYSLPFGKGKAFSTTNPIVDQLIGGWQTTAALTVQAGMPFGPVCTAVSNTALASGGTLNGRCSRVVGQPLQLPANEQRYYSGSEQLTLPDGRIITPPTNTFMKWNPDAWNEPTITFANGSSAIDQYTQPTSSLDYANMRTPGVQNLNLSVIKRFPITERVGFDLHINATNALNHTNHIFSSNSGVSANNLVGAVTKAAALTNTGVGQNSNTAYGSYGLTALEARQLTVQANFTF